MVVDGKVELIMAVHVDDIVIAGSDETCRDFHAAFTTKFPTNNLGELTWYTGCAFKRNWEVGTLEITQKCVTLSTAEAEYVALGEGVKEALFTGAVLSFICPELSGSFPGF